jgi:hypothetical protein
MAQVKQPFHTGIYCAINQRTRALDINLHQAFARAAPFAACQVKNCIDANHSGAQTSLVGQAADSNIYRYAQG